MDVRTYIKENHYEDVVKNSLSKIDTCQNKMNEAMHAYDSSKYEEASAEKQRAEFELGMMLIAYNETNTPLSASKFMAECRKV